MIDKSSHDRVFAIADATIQDLLKAGWHPDRIIEAVTLILKDHPDWSESLTSDMVWGDYEIFLETGGIRKKQRPIASEIKRYIDGMEGELFLSDLYEALQVSLPQDKAAAQMALSRLSSDGGPLEKLGRGRFRVKVEDCEKINIFNTAGDELNVKYPLGIHELFITHPKNVVVVAGESDAGKSAFMMNFAALNKDNYPVTYFSSEMGGLELKSRLIKYNKGLEFWQNVDFRERSSDYADVIRPDGINIIDYIEINDQFYLIAKYIKGIFDKLNKGIAVISLQKDEGSDYARGKAFSAEKARLYITMEKINRTKIVKCKNWRNEMNNPNGLCCRWKLVGGIKFQPNKKPDGTIEWVKEDEPQKKGKSYPY